MWRISFSLVFLCACNTGSNFEKLKSSRPAPVPAAEGYPILGSYSIRPFTFTPAEDRSDMFRKAFVVPGYKGIDFDGYGRLAEGDRKSGMKTLYTLPDPHARVAAHLAKIGVSIAEVPDGKAPLYTVQVHVESSEAGMRMHTYGCWPFVGFFVYLVNGDVYTVIFQTQLEYKVFDGEKLVKSEKRKIHTETTFGFWSSWAGFEIVESYDAGLEAHLGDIATTIETALRQQP